MLDGINDPGNLGTILRISDWFGIKTIICSENTVDLYNPKTIQASMGSLFRVDVYYQNLEEVIREFGDKTEIFGTFLEGNNIYHEQLPDKGIIIIGSESHGISNAIAKSVNRKLFIPPFSNGAESLNASIATAIVCSEFRRK
jgi:TrmH family RNA methyltransferase